MHIHIHFLHVIRRAKQRLPTKAMKRMPHRGLFPPRLASIKSTMACLATTKGSGRYYILKYVIYIYTFPCRFHGPLFSHGLNHPVTCALAWAGWQRGRLPGTLWQPRVRLMTQIVLKRPISPPGEKVKASPAQAPFANPRRRKTHWWL